MKPEGSSRHFLTALILAIVVYAVAYKAIEHRRRIKGPWEVTFTNTLEGHLVIAVDQPRLGISNVQVQFAERVQVPFTNLVKRSFQEARAVPYDLPFGKCVFMDTTFLPGTIAMEVFGHEIQLLPRVLTIDRQEAIWNSGGRIILDEADNGH